MQSQSEPEASYRNASIAEPHFDRSHAAALCLPWSVRRHSVHVQLVHPNPQGVPLAPVQVFSLSLRNVYITTYYKAKRTTRGLTSSRGSSHAGSRPPLCPQCAQSAEQPAHNGLGTSLLHSAEQTLCCLLPVFPQKAEYVSAQQHSITVCAKNRPRVGCFHHA